MATPKSTVSSAHGKLHKRGNSTSSVNNSFSPLSPDVSSFSFKRSDTPKVTYEEPFSAIWSEPARPAPAVTKPLKIKPYLRKLSVKDSKALDLSRPAAENESLAGLGIHEFGGNARSASDVNFSPISGRSRHHRSTSNTSQFSTSSSLQRPTVPYMHPMRQTPRPYTPPISKSSPASIIGSDAEEADDILSDEELRYRQHMFDPARRSGSISSTPGASAPLRIHTSGSSTRLGSYSQTSLPITSPPTHARDTLKSVDTTTSPSSRTSFDKAFGFIRGGRDSPVDPASRAASIRAARQAYQEKEAAKERKAEKEAMKQADRDIRKKTKQDERLRRKSDAQEKRSRSVSNEKMTTPIPGREYSNYTPAHSRSLPARVATVDPNKEMRTTPQVTTRRAAKSRWLAFVTWFRTRLLRFGKKLRVSP
ncbi:hypothetical protein AOQ84DRAFT_364364 [Glonium stellatum]|uniref:Uncharacterized protein n=1 Tax=Glonium stellatum TaxID=574774 RepID=A0A8E2JT27_9PEZI|nr:hypothetical protein AOQ84DRAFT_364364 [Glonium stellatum]